MILNHIYEKKYIFLYVYDVNVNKYVFGKKIYYQQILDKKK